MGAPAQKIVVVNGEIWSAPRKKIQQFLELQLAGRKPAIFDFAKRKDATPLIIEDINDKDEIRTMIEVIKEEIATEAALGNGTTVEAAV